MPASKSSRLPPKKWTPQAKMELLLTVIRTYKVKINYAEIAVILGDVTAGAVKEQYNSLKRGGRRKMELDLSGKKFDMDWKEESDDDDDWKGSGVKAER